MRLKYYLSLCLVVFLGGCGDSTGPDKDAPQFKNLVNANTLMVNDTFSIEFDEDVRIDLITVDTVSGLFDFAFSGERKILVYGTNYKNIQNTFTPDIDVAFKINSIMDINGNGPVTSEIITLKFHSWLDKDYYNIDYVMGDTLTNLTTFSSWVNGQPVTQTLVSQGILYEQGSRVDVNDYKILAMSAYDSLTMELNYRTGKNITVQLIGPYKLTDITDSLPSDIDSPPASSIIWERLEQTGGKISVIKLEMEGKHHIGQVGNSGPGIYIIKIHAKSFDDFCFYNLKTTIKPF